MNETSQASADAPPEDDIGVPITAIECGLVQHAADLLAARSETLGPLLGELEDIASLLATGQVAARQPADAIADPEPVTGSGIVSTAAPSNAVPVSLPSPESGPMTLVDASAASRGRVKPPERKRTPRRAPSFDEAIAVQLALPLMSEDRPSVAVASFAERLNRVRAGLAREEQDVEKGSPAAVLSFAERFSTTRARLAREDLENGWTSAESA